MSLGPVGGDRLINNGLEIGSQDQQALTNVTDGLSKGDLQQAKINDSLQAFQDVGSDNSLGGPTTEAGGQVPPGDYYNDLSKFDNSNVAVATHLNDPSFDFNSHLQDLHSNLSAITDGTSNTISTSEGSITPGADQNALVGAYEKQQDRYNADVNELLNLDTSTPAGQKRAFELEQDIQQINQMMTLISNLLQQQNDLMKNIISNFNR